MVVAYTGAEGCDLDSAVRGVSDHGNSVLQFPLGCRSFRKIQSNIIRRRLDVRRNSKPVGGIHSVLDDDWMCWEQIVEYTGCEWSSCQNKLCTGKLRHFVFLAVVRKTYTRQFCLVVEGSAQGCVAKPERNAQSLTLCQKPGCKLGGVTTLMLAG